MNTRIQYIMAIAILYGIIGLGTLASAQNPSRELTVMVVLSTGPNESIEVTLPQGTPPPEHPRDWARLLYQKVK